MTTLMPQGARRYCAACDYHFFTAYMLALDCPRCGNGMPDHSLGAYHVCSAGHSSRRDGACLPCSLLASAKQAKEERRVAVVAEWVDRT